MKSLKGIFLVVLFTTGILTYGQSKVEKEIEIQGLGITVNTMEELKTINWDDLFSVFNNEKPDSKISVSIQLEDVNVVSTDNEKMSFSNIKYALSGYVHEKEKLKENIKVITHKLVSKYQDE